MKGVAPKKIAMRYLYLYCGVIPFALIQVFAVALTFLYPKLVTCLPELMYRIQR